MFLFELHDENDVRIFPIRNAIGPGFNMVMQDDGNGQFSLLRDDEQVREIFEGHIVHVYIDGQDVFQWVIEDIQEAYGESAGNLITYKGRDTRVLLDYAIIYPDGWPPPGADPRVPQYAPSILINGEFESDGGTNPAPGWTQYPASFTYVNAVGNGTKRPNDQTATKSLRLQSYQNLPYTTGASQAGFFNAIMNREAESGKSKWRITAAVKIISDTFGNSEAAVRFTWYDTRGNSLGAVTQETNIHDAWETLEVVADVDETATSYLIELRGRGQAVWDWDLIQLQAVYSDALPQYPSIDTSRQVTYGDNLVQNGNFVDSVYTGQLPNYWSAPPDIIPKITRLGIVTKDGIKSAISFLRTFPDQEGFTMWQDVPVEEGRGYLLTAYLVATNAHLDYDSTVPSRWFVRQWVDAQGNLIGQEMSDLAKVPRYIASDPFTEYEFPVRVAPPGAAKVRITLIAPPNIPYPAFMDVSLKRAAISVSGDYGPGVIKGFENLRAGDIIRELIDSTAERKSRPGVNEPWNISMGVVEYDRDYDVIDGVVIPKDQVASIQYRFDYLGSAIRSLALGRGEIRIRPRSQTELDQGLTGFVLDYYVAHGTDRSLDIIFREGIDIQSIPEKAHSVKGIRNKLIVEGQGTGTSVIAVEVKDNEKISKYRGIREGYLDRKNSAHMIDLKKEGQAAIDDLDLAATNFTITVSTHLYKPFVDYFLGDAVHVSVPRLGIEKKCRIMAMAGVPTPGGAIDTIAIDLDSSAYDAFTAAMKGQQTSVAAIQAIQRLPQGNSVLYQVNDSQVLDGKHPFNFKFYVPSTPTYTNQIRLAFQGEKFRSPVSFAEETKTSSAGGAVPQRILKTSTWDGDKDIPVSNSTSFSSIVPIGTPRDPIGTGTAAPTVNLTHNHTVQIPSVPAHTHTVPTYKIQYGLFEGPAPKNLVATVNGQKLDPLAYDYSDVGAADIEIGRLVKRGWNTVTFTSDTLGTVIVQVIIQAYLSNNGID